MGGLLNGVFSWLSGAPQAASTTGNYYQDAANSIINGYGARNPAVSTFAAEQNAALQPYFTQQRQNALDTVNALGLRGSGAGTNLLDSMYAGQSATLAGQVAPLWQQGLSEYGNIIGQEPGAQVNSYNQAIQQFLDAASMAAGGAGYGAGGGGSPTPGGGAFDASGNYTGFGGFDPSYNYGGLTPAASSPGVGAGGTQYYDGPSYG